jgi:hypothetical protein
MSSSETRAIKRGRQRLDRSTVQCRVGGPTPFPIPLIRASSTPRRGVGPLCQSQRQYATIECENFPYVFKRSPRTSAAKEITSRY